MSCNLMQQKERWGKSSISLEDSCCRVKGLSLALAKALSVLREANNKVA